MSRTGILCMMVGVLLTGCATSPPTAVQLAQQALLPAATEITDPLRRAELLGRAIYQKDILAARATDIMMARGSASDKARIGGWVTVPDDGAWVVYFLDRAPRNPTIVLEIRFPDSSGAGGQIGEPGRRPDLEGLAAAMFTARQRALTAPYRECLQSYNSVVLPAELAGDDGWYVYLLAATTQHNVAVLGGHVRVHVSADGTEILNVKEFTRSCLSVPIEDNAVGLMVTQVVDTHPVETHVFISLLYRTPLYVVGAWPGSTIEDSWIVENGSIRPHRF